MAEAIDRNCLQPQDSNVKGGSGEPANLAKISSNIDNKHSR